MQILAAQTLCRACCRVKQDLSALLMAVTCCCCRLQPCRSLEMGRTDTSQVEAAIPCQVRNQMKLANIWEEL